MDSWRLDGTWSVTSPAGGNRVVLLEAQGARRLRVIVWGYHGPTLPPELVDARLEPDARGYRVSWGGGQATFEARWLDRQLSLPALFAPLHAQFRLQGRDRWVVRLLMGLLQLPGGERLLRAWHTRRR